MINIAILGFGTVGSGVWDVLQKNAELIARRVTSARQALCAGRGGFMINIAILGFGTVGSGVWDVLQKNAELIARRAGREIRVKRILVLEVTENPELFTSSIDDILNDPEITMAAEAIGGVKAASGSWCWRLPKTRSCSPAASTIF